MKQHLSVRIGKGPLGRQLFLRNAETGETTIIGVRQQTLDEALERAAYIAGYLEPWQQETWLQEVEEAYERLKAVEDRTAMRQKAIRERRRSNPRRRRGPPPQIGVYLEQRHAARGDARWVLVYQTGSLADANEKAEVLRAHGRNVVVRNLGPQEERRNPRRRDRNPPRHADRPYPELLESNRGAVKTPANWNYIATLVNPKDHRVVSVVLQWDQEYVRIGEPVDDPERFRRIGGSYLEVNHDPTELTGCVRVHTPAGVSVQGIGLGALLYSGSALAAAYIHFSLDVERKRYWGSGPCVSSWDGPNGNDRSYSAATLWRQAVEKGIAEEQEVGRDRMCENVSTRVTRDIDASEFDADTLLSEADIQDWRDAYIDDIDPSEISENVYITVCGDKVLTAQLMYAQAICDAGLVLHLHPLLAENLRWSPPPAEAILGMDFRFCESEGLLHYVWRLLVAARTPWDVLRAFYSRNFPAWHRSRLGIETLGRSDAPPLRGYDHGDYDEASTSSVSAKAKANPSSVQGPMRQEQVWQRYYGRALEWIDAAEEETARQPRKNPRKQDYKRDRRGR